MSDIGAPAKVDNPKVSSQNGESSISDLTYRNYDGPLNPPLFRWWVVAQSGLKLIFGKWWFYLLAGFPMLRFLLTGFQIYFFSQIGSAIPNFFGEPEGQRYALKFWSALNGETNSTMMLIITIVAGAGCIAADNRSNALLVYFSKPMTKADYLLGKWLSVFLTLLVVNLLPVVMLYLFCIISYRDDGFLKDEPWLGPRLLLAVLVPALLHSSLIVGISSWSKSPRIVAAVYASIYVLGGIVAGNVLGNSLYKDNPEMQNLVQHMSIGGLISGISQNILHVVVNRFSFSRGAPVVTVEILKIWPLLAIASCLVAASITAAWMKIRAVEVVKG